MQWEHSSLRDSCVYNQNGQPLWKSQMSQREECYNSIYLPSRWHYGAESLGIETTSCVWLILAFDLSHFSFFTILMTNTTDKWYYKIKLNHAKSVGLLLGSNKEL